MLVIVIDSFQRRMLRQAINIRWPKKISSQKLYEMTKVEPWSRTIRRRRLNWLGYLIRLSPETPARISLYEALRTTKRKRGKAKTTWLKVIEKDLNGNVKLTHPPNINELDTVVNPPLSSDHDTPAKFATCTWSQFTNVLRRLRSELLNPGM